VFRASEKRRRQLIPAIWAWVIVAGSRPWGPDRELGGLGWACHRRSGTLQLVLDADAGVSDDSQTAGSGMARPASASPAIAAERACGRDGWQTWNDAAHLAHIPQFFDRHGPARFAGPCYTTSLAVARGAGLFERSRSDPNGSSSVGLDVGRRTRWCASASRLAANVSVSWRDRMTVATFIVAAFAEIAGCFAVWAWARSNASILWIGPGVVCLLLFAWLLTTVQVDFAGRAYAAYGGVYIAASIAWLWAVEGRLPDRWDLAGTALCLAGAAVILYGPRPS